MDEKSYKTYMVLCSDNSLYCGWTTDIVKRVKAHNGIIGGGAKYTRNRRPVKLVYVESFHTKQEAQQREYAIKQWRRPKKVSLIESDVNEIEATK